ncbi:hemagglutinin repeat-containing protein [Pseudoduganella sp. HUAS MS19]
MNQGGVIDSGNGRTILLAGEDIINRGGAIKGGDVTLQAGRDIKNETLTVDSKWSSKVNGGSYTSLSNQATISATNGLVMDAGRNLIDLAGTINAGGSASIFAGNNISFDTVKTGSTYHALIDGNAENTSAVYNQVSRVNVGGDLLMAATGNLNLAGTQVSIGTKGSGAGTLLAGGAVNINAVVDEVKTSLQDDKTRKNWGKDIHENQSVVGARVASTGDLLVSAGISQSSDLNVTGSALAAGGTLTLKASKDLNIGSVAETHFSDMENHSKSGNKIKKSSSDITDYNATTLAIGSSIKGGNVVATSGGDTLIKGSAVLADKDLSIDAKGGLKIVSAEETSKTSSSRQEKKSGFSVSYSSGNLSTGYGKSSTSSQSAQETVTQLASSIGALDGSVKLKAGETLQVVASDIAAKENLTLIGKNVDLAAAQNTSVSQVNAQSKSSGFGVGFTVNPVKAFNDAYKSSTENSKSGSFIGKEFAKAEGAAEGGMAAVSVVNAQISNKSTNSTQNHATSEARTSTLTAGKDLTILATDGSITSQGAQISAEGNALIMAKDSIRFDVAHNTEGKMQESKKSGFSIDTRSAQVIGSLNNKSDGNGTTDTVTGTKLSVGGSTTMATQTGDITLVGSNVVSEGKLSINAARDLTITSAQDTLHNANQSNNKAIGKVVISDTERFSGYHNEKHKDNSDQVTQVAANVSSLKGDVNLTAGGKYTQTSSNVLAGNDVNITAKTIDITALQNTGSHQESNSDLKIGAFARISSPLIDLANNIEAARKSDGRLETMQRMAAASNAYQAGSAISSMAGGPGSGILVKGEAGIGFASSSNASNGSDSTAQGSTVNGGRNVTLTATGGDIHATGATLNAGKTLSLDAAQNIVLDASQSMLHSDGKNRSSGVEAGVGFQVGAQTGVYFYAAANVGKGHNKNDTTINNNTALNAETINITSKGDTTLKGATATANKINTDVGGKLAIESLQDTGQFERVQTNAGVRVQMGFGVWSANGNLSQQKGSGTYAGVGQQSGLFAGDGGYHVKADTIDLKGGAITSTNAAASELTTNKLTTSDIENKMTYSASNVSMAGGTGGKSELLRDADGKLLPFSQQTQAFGTAKDGNTAPGLPTLERGSDSSTTYATITDGKITIGGVTTSSVKDLGINTDASKANTALAKLPDLQQLLKDQQAMSAAAGTVIATGKQIAGDIAGDAAKKQKEAQKTLEDVNITAEKRAEANRQIEEAQKTLKDWGPGGLYSRALNAGVSVLTGAVAGQGGGQITANAIAPTAAKMVGDIGTGLQNEARSEANRLTGLAQQAADRGDMAAAAEYGAKANEAATTAAKWDDNGIYRVGLHAATQGMLGGLAGGQAGALESAVGVVGGNLGQQLGAQLGNAEAEKLGLKGDEKRAFVNAFQQTGAAVGGMVAGAAAGNLSDGNVDVSSLLAAAQGGQAAGTVDTYNRQLHLTESVKLAALKKGKTAAEQHKLDAAACALVHCAEGVPASDARFKQLNDLQKEGLLYTDQLAELRRTGEFVHDPKLDTTRDWITKNGETFRRTGGLINLGAGTVGTFAGGAIGVAGAASCVETLGLGCLVAGFGGYIAKTSNDQAHEGSRALFGRYKSDEGQRVLDSFNPQTYPGENDPIRNAIWGSAKLGAGVLLYKYGPKIIGSVEDRLLAGASSKKPGLEPTSTANDGGQVKVVGGGPPAANDTTYGRNVPVGGDNTASAKGKPSNSSSTESGATPEKASENGNSAIPDYIATTNGDIGATAGLGPRKLRALERELQVVEITGGKSAQTARVGENGRVITEDTPIYRDGQVASGIDVYGKNGELIQVGGPGKNSNDAVFVRAMRALEHALIHKSKIRKQA